MTFEAIRAAIERHRGMADLLINAGFLAHPRCKIGSNHGQFYTNQAICIWWDSLREADRTSLCDILLDNMREAEEVAMAKAENEIRGQTKET